MLVDEDHRELVISAARCSSPDYLHKMPLKIEDSLIGRVVREGQSGDRAERARRKAVSISGTGAQNRFGIAAFVPLFSRDKVIGTVNIYTANSALFR